MKKILVHLFLFCFPIICNAQIVIEERVEIDGKPLGNNNKCSTIVYTDSVVSNFIMPANGILRIGYNYCKLFNLELPDYSTVSTYFFKGDSTYIDTLSNIFAFYDSLGFSFYDSCLQQVKFLQRKTYYGEPFPIHIVNLGYVTEGDSVHFIYHSDMWGEEADLPLWCNASDGKGIS